MDSNARMRNGHDVLLNEDMPGPSRPPRTKLKAKEKSSAAAHKAALSRLQQNDPEFYKFLQSNDAKLLDFDVSSGSDHSDDETDNAVYHKPPTTLEVASDASEYEPSDDDAAADVVKTQSSRSSAGRKLVTMKMVKEWDRAFEHPTVALVREVVRAFQAAVELAGVEAGTNSSHFVVEDSTTFNAVVRLCLSHMSTALQTLLKLKQLPSGATKNLADMLATSKNGSARWRKLKNISKTYLIALSKLLGELEEENAVGLILKHIARLTPYYACFSKISKLLLKQLIRVWSRREERCRVLAFVALMKLIRLCAEELVGQAVRQMYTAYVKHTKLVSEVTWPCIIFMQRSYAEVCRLDTGVTYQYAFVYIRQLAIHLRNAIASRKKEQIGHVYNWQFVQSLYLWARVLSTLHLDTTLEPLRYPLIQVTFGCARLLPTEKYSPLRLHCARCLTMLADSTNVFVPVVSLVLELFDVVNFNKKHTRQSLKPFAFDCLLKLSKSQMKESGFKDGLIEEMQALLLEAFHCFVSSCAFPEMLMAYQMRVKSFLKGCRVANYTRSLKQLTTTLEQHAVFVEARRKETHMSFADDQSVADFEDYLLRATDAPLTKYFQAWKKLRERELQHRIAQKNEVVDMDVQKVPRRIGKTSAATASKQQQSPESFAQMIEAEDTSDVDMPDEVRFLPPEMRPVTTQSTRRTALKFADSSTEDDSSREESNANIKTAKRKRRAIRAEDAKSARSKREKQNHLKLIKQSKERRILPPVGDTVTELVLSDSD